MAIQTNVTAEAVKDDQFIQKPVAETPKVILSNKEKLHEEREAQADEILLSGMSLGEYLEYSFTQNLMA